LIGPGLDFLGSHHTVCVRIEGKNPIQIALIEYQTHLDLVAGRFDVDLAVTGAQIVCHPIPPETQKHQNCSGKPVQSWQVQPNPAASEKKKEELSHANLESSFQDHAFHVWR